MRPRYTKDSTNHSEDTSDAYYADQESRSDAERESKTDYDCFGHGMFIVMRNDGREFCGCCGEEITKVE